MAASKLSTLGKLSGSFAFSGLLASEVCTTSDGEVHPLSLASLLLPKTAHALTIFRSNQQDTEQTARVKAFYALDESSRFTKVYPVELRVKSLSSQLSRSNLGMASVRAFGLTYLPLVEGYFQALKEAEESAAQDGRELNWEELPEYDWEKAKAKLPQALLALAREVVTGIVRVLLTWLAVDYLDSRLVWKMIKDQVPSLRAKQGYPFYKRPVMVTRTVLRGSVITTVAEVIVASALEIARVLTSKQIPEGMKWRVLARHLTIIPLRLTVNLVASSVAAGIVGTVRPGRACLLASIAAGFLTDTFVCVPALQEYHSKGRVSRRTTLIISGCATVVVLCFLPWIAFPLPSSSYSHQHQLALN